MNENLQKSIMNLRSSHRRCSVKKVVLRNFAKFTGKHLCQSRFLNKVPVLRPATLLKKTMAQVFSCEFCEIFKNTFLYRTPPDDCFWNLSRLINRYEKEKIESGRSAYRKWKNCCFKFLRMTKEEFCNKFNWKHITENKLFWKTVNPSLKVQSCKLKKY